MPPVQGDKISACNYWTIAQSKAVAAEMAVVSPKDLLNKQIDKFS
jgi:hypothetical protein